MKEKRYTKKQVIYTILLTAALTLGGGEGNDGGGAQAVVLVIFLEGQVMVEPRALVAGDLGVNERSLDRFQLGAQGFVLGAELVHVGKIHAKSANGIPRAGGDPLEGVDDGRTHRAEQRAPAHQREHAGEQSNRQSKREAGYEKFTFDRVYLLLA